MLGIWYVVQITGILEQLSETDGKMKSYKMPEHYYCYVFFI